MNQQKENEAQEAQREYEQRVQFLSKLTGVPTQEVDRVIARISQILQEKGEDVELDAHDISCYTMVKFERVKALMVAVSALNTHAARWEPYITKAKFR